MRSPGWLSTGDGMKSRFMRSRGSGCDMLSHDTRHTVSGRIVVVSGATGGLGVAVVEAFLKADDHVVGISRSQSDRLGGNYLHIPADLTSAAGVEAVFARAIERFGRIDVVVHTMGGF